MESTRPEQKPATAARIYDYYIGGTHHFPADRAAAELTIRQVPLVPAAARANRAFLRRAVRYVASAGVDQFLDLGSGIPTAGNVHEIAQAVNPLARVVYVDIDPVAVAEGLEILESNDLATSIIGDLRDTADVLTHPEITRLLDLRRPTAVILCSVLHFIPEQEVAMRAVGTLRDALAPGSHLVLSHATSDGSAEAQNRYAARDGGAGDTYSAQASTAFHARTRAEVSAFFDDFDLAEPGLTWVPAWRPDPADPGEMSTDPRRCSILGGVGRLHGRAGSAPPADRADRSAQEDQAPRTDTGRGGAT